MISLILDTATVEKALVSYLGNELGLATHGKSFDITVVVGRKTGDKLKPEISATIDIYNADEVKTETSVESTEEEEVEKETIEDTKEDQEKTEEVVPEPTPFTKPSSSIF